MKNPRLNDLDVHRKGSCRLTWRGMISLGLRKAIALVSGRSYPLASLVDVSRNTVIRAEVLTGAFFVARSSVFHNSIYAILKEISRRRQAVNATEDDLEHQSQMVAVDLDVSPAVAASQDDMICSYFNVPRLTDADMALLTSDKSDGSFIIGCTAFSNDATNSSIFQRQKLQGLIVTSSLLKNWLALKQQNYQEMFASMTSL